MKKVAFEVVHGGDGVPSEPDWTKYFSDDIDLAFVREQWRTIISEMRSAQTLSIANGHAILRLVYARLEFDRCMRQVAELGAVRLVKGHWRKSPSWIVARQANDIAMAAEGELGLSPAKRSKAGKVARRVRKPIPADEFLKSRT